MSTHSFRSVFMVASCATAALGCYLVSLRVASERAALEQVETKIVLAQRDLRVLQTEIGTRGRLAQLERWNVKVLALSAPTADQFLGGSFELARMTAPEKTVDFEAPVVLASAPRPERPPPIGEPARSDAQEARPLDPRALLHEASVKIPTREVPAKAAATQPPAAADKPAEQPVTAAKPVSKASAGKPGLAAAQPKKKSVDKADRASASPPTKPVRLAKVDPLAPLPAKATAAPKSKPSRDATKTQ